MLRVTVSTIVLYVQEQTFVSLRHFFGELTNDTGSQRHIVIHEKGETSTSNNSLNRRDNNADNNDSGSDQGGKRKTKAGISHVSNKGDSGS